MPNHGQHYEGQRKYKKINLNINKLQGLTAKCTAIKQNVAA